MKIFTIPGWYKTKKNQQACIFIYEQMQALKKIGNEIIVLSVQPTRNIINKHTEIVDDCGIKTYYDYAFGIWPSKLKYNWLFFYEKKIKKVFDKAVKENGIPDVIYAHFSYPAGYVAIKLGKKYKIPVVIQEHFSELMKDKIDWKLKRITKKCVLYSDKYICVSSNLKKSIIRQCKVGENIIVVSNMINKCFIYKKPKEKKDFIFCSVGSLIKRKGFDILIKAFMLDFKDNDSVKLYIAGSGKEKKNLSKLIENNNMTNKIKLLGQLNRKETLNLYENSNCFVLASRAETYGLVYREALAVGRPIISTKHGGFSDNDWNDIYGELIEIDSLEQLRESLLKIYLNYSKYDLKEISKLCLKDCSEDNVIKRINDILEKARWH